MARVPTTSAAASDSRRTGEASRWFSRNLMLDAPDGAVNGPRTETVAFARLVPAETRSYSARGARASGDAAATPDRSSPLGFRTAAVRWVASEPCRRVIQQGTP